MIYTFISTIYMERSRRSALRKKTQTEKNRNPQEQEEAQIEQTQEQMRYLAAGRLAAALFF
jgi:hypothetical protein